MNARPNCRHAYDPNALPSVSASGYPSEGRTRQGRGCERRISVPTAPPAVERAEPVSRLSRRVGGGVVTQSRRGRDTLASGQANGGRNRAGASLCGATGSEAARRPNQSAGRITEGAARATSGIPELSEADAQACGAMRTSFFGYEKSKCALPACASLFRGADAGVGVRGGFVLVRSRDQGEANKKKAPRARGVDSVGEAVVLANLFDGLVLEADPENRVLMGLECEGGFVSFADLECVSCCLFDVECFDLFDPVSQSNFHVNLLGVGLPVRHLLPDGRGGGTGVYSCCSVCERVAFWL